MALAAKSWIWVAAGDLFLNYLREVGAKGIGLTLSQRAVCCLPSIRVQKSISRTAVGVTPEDYGTFDAVASVGAFEHFCSVEDYKAGRQDQVYRQFLKLSVICFPGGRCFIQTMVFDQGMIDLDKFDINASKDSAEYLMALAANEFPGSWLPYGLRSRSSRMPGPTFTLVTHHSGKADYIETIKVWRRRLKRFGWQKYLAYLSLTPSL